jgi:hypothetical protein
MLLMGASTPGAEVGSRLHLERCVPHVHENGSGGRDLVICPPVGARRLALTNDLIDPFFQRQKPGRTRRGRIWGTCVPLPHVGFKKVWRTFLHM